MSQSEPEPELPRTPTIDARGAPAELGATARDHARAAASRDCASPGA